MMLMARIRGEPQERLIVLRRACDPCTLHHHRVEQFDAIGEVMQRWDSRGRMTTYLSKVIVISIIYPKT